MVGRGSKPVVQVIGPQSAAVISGAILLSSKQSFAIVAPCCRSPRFTALALLLT